MVQIRLPVYEVNDVNLDSQFLLRLKGYDTNDDITAYAPRYFAVSLSTIPNGRDWSLAS